MLSVKQDGIKYHFWQSLVWLKPGIEPWSSGPLANTVPIRPMVRWYIYIYIYIYIYTHTHKKQENLITYFSNPSTLTSSCKKFTATLLFVDFSKTFDSIHRRKTDGPPQRNCCSYNGLKNLKVKVCSPEGNRILWHYCWCSARGYISPISVHNLPRLCTLNIDRSHERKWFYTKKGKKQTILCTITDINYKDDIASSKYTYPSPSWCNWGVLVV